MKPTRPAETIKSVKAALMIGCGAVINEIQHLVNGRNLTMKTIDAGLHLHPEKLKSALQQAIDEQDGIYDPIILGFGLCSNAVVGLKAQSSTLIVPKVDDCVAMLLGSQTRYKDELAKAPGTYFLSRGWIDAGVTLVDEFREMAERFGEKRARKIQKKMFSHYTRLAYITSQDSDQTPYRKVSQQAAKELDLDYQELPGTDRLLQAMVTGQWNDDFIVAPPGHAISLLDFKSAASSPLKENVLS